MKIPKKWCIEGCTDLRLYLNSVRKLNPTHVANISGDNLNWCYFLEGLKWNGKDSQSSKLRGYVKITFEEFEKYILNKQTDVPENYKYLTTFLKKLKIK